MARGKRESARVRALSDLHPYGIDLGCGEYGEVPAEMRDSLIAAGLIDCEAGESEE
jgi:hypothetical protein